LLAHGRWFSPGTPASSTTITGCHDIAELNIAESDVKTHKIKIIKTYGLKNAEITEISYPYNLTGDYRDSCLWLFYENV
jgi:hypothetical protein